MFNELFLLAFAHNVIFFVLFTEFLPSEPQKLSEAQYPHWQLSQEYFIQCLGTQQVWLSSIYT